MDRHSPQDLRLASVRAIELNRDLDERGGLWDVESLPADRRNVTALRARLPRDPLAHNQLRIARRMGGLLSPVLEVKGRPDVGRRLGA
jgi:hypothetical protein